MLHTKQMNIECDYDKGNQTEGNIRYLIGVGGAAAAPPPPHQRRAQLDIFEIRLFSSLLPPPPQVLAGTRLKCRVWSVTLKGKSGADLT